MNKKSIILVFGLVLMVSGCINENYEHPTTPSHVPQRNIVTIIENVNTTPINIVCWENETKIIETIELFIYQRGESENIYTSYENSVETVHTIIHPNIEFYYDDELSAVNAIENIYSHDCSPRLSIDYCISYHIEEHVDGIETINTTEMIFYPSWLANCIEYERNNQLNCIKDRFNDYFYEIGWKEMREHA